MALSRRTGTRFQASIWPGFVDAMTGLLLVLMFLLTIFMVVQFVLRETISGQENELDALSSEVSALADALGLEERKSAQLETRIGTLNATLTQAQDDLADQANIIASLTQQRDRQTEALTAAQDRITTFEAEVAGLLADRGQALETIATLSAERDRLVSDQEALTLALAQRRGEIDAQAEAARLAAMRREALEALVADLQRDKSNNAEAIATLSEQLEAEEAGRLADAAAVEALRDRLRNADAELTAMTLALERQRQEAEDTLTLLAAADAARKTLDGELTEALALIAAARTEVGERDALVDRLNRALNQMDATQTENQRALATLQAELDRARTEQVQTEAELAERLSQAETANRQLQADLARTRADLEVARSDATETEMSRAAVEARLLAALESLERSQVAATDRDVLQARLAAALTAQQAAETRADDEQALAEQRAALLAQARVSLSEEERVSEQARRQTALLNQQVAALRTQLGGLQALLDDFRDRDAAAKVQLETLGSDLNAALARAASEERKRRLLEEAERKRLEDEARALEAKAQALEAETRDLAAQAQYLERYRSEFFGRLRDLLGNQDGVRIEGDRFVFSSEVLFPPGGADLSVEGEAEIAKVAQILRSVARDIPPEIDWVIRVDGHTDDVPLISNGRYRDNWELSQGRALSVVRYMVEFLGIPPDRLSANGFGQYQPVNPADTVEARAQNRRSELKLTEK
jgi:chemotaxis protein MotB